MEQLIKSVNLSIKFVKDNKEKIEKKELDNSITGLKLGILEIFSNKYKNS